MIRFLQLLDSDNEDFQEGLKIGFHLALAIVFFVTIIIVTSTNGLPH